MKLTKHELSIGESLNRPISKHDVIRLDEWMDLYRDELFRLAKIGIEAESKSEKVAHPNTP
jgi:hypothetical protein